MVSQITSHVTLTVMKTIYDSVSSMTIHTQEDCVTQNLETIPGDTYGTRKGDTMDAVSLHHQARQHTLTHCELLD